jgi:hypothetical protein
MSETPEGADRVELILAFNRFADKADALLKGGTNQTVTLSGGSFGFQVAVTCCAVMLTALLVAGFWVSREFNRIDNRFNDQTDTDSVQDAYIHKLRAEQPKKEKP